MKPDKLRRQLKRLKNKRASRVTGNHAIRKISTRNTPTTSGNVNVGTDGVVKISKPAKRVRQKTKSQPMEKRVIDRKLNKIAKSGGTSPSAATPRRKSGGCGGCRRQKKES